MTVRIIPRLDIKGSNLVKGISLEGLRILGKPQHFAKFYAENGADELFYQDIVASLYERNSILNIVETTAQEIFIPLTVGGGLRKLSDIRDALRAGADKVAINTAAIRKPELISEAAQQFGSSTIVVSIEAKKMPDGTYEAYTDCGRERTGIEAIGWAKTAAKLGAGEIMITAIDREGTGSGYDNNLTRAIVDAVSVPVIACGGAGKLEHVRDVIIDGHTEAVSLAAMLHYTLLKRKPELFGQDQLFQKGFSRVNETTINELKQFLLAHNIACRIEN